MDIKDSYRSYITFQERKNGFVLQDSAQVL
jgi:hypothetical protein